MAFILGRFIFQKRVNEMLSGMKYADIMRASFNNNTFSIIIKTKTHDMGDLLNTLRALYSNSVNYYL